MQSTRRFPIDVMFDSEAFIFVFFLFLCFTYYRFFYYFVERSCAFGKRVSEMSQE